MYTNKYTHVGDSVAQVKSWAQQNDKFGTQDYPRWKGIFKFYFGPEREMTSTECLTWKNVKDELEPQCKPMGGQSVWASLGGRSGLQGKQTVLLTAGEMLDIWTTHVGSSDHFSTRMI